MQHLISFFELLLSVSQVLRAKLLEGRSRISLHKDLVRWELCWLILATPPGKYDLNHHFASLNESGKVIKRIKNMVAYPVYHGNNAATESKMIPDVFSKGE